jgi:hypothetical protein
MKLLFEWLKVIYGAVGTPYPRLSLVVVAALGAISFAAVWLFAAKLVEKDQLKSNSPSHVTGPASTTGDKSPAVSGNGNEIKYDESSHQENKAEPPKKESKP